MFLAAGLTFNWSIDLPLIYFATSMNYMANSNKDPFFESDCFSVQSVYDTTLPKYCLCVYMDRGHPGRDVA